MNILVSACLLGVRCRYDGTGKPVPDMDRLMAKYTCIPACPEQLGGLPTPREPSERRGDGVYARSGQDVTARFRLGAEETLRLCRLYHCRTAVLKERSPSCGHDEIYDGTFGKALAAGDGVAAELLRANGIRVLGESEIEQLL